MVTLALALYTDAKVLFTIVKFRVIYDFRHIS